VAFGLPDPNSKTIPQLKKCLASKGVRVPPKAKAADLRENEIWPLWTVSGHYVLEYPYDMIWPL
jgi:hypothetical protein